MTLNEYKSNKIKEINYFLRGINFQNIGIKEKPIINHSPECDEFFNKNRIFREITERFLNKIKEYYNNLLDTELEFASSQEEIDRAVLNFVEKTKEELNNYKNLIIKAAFKSVEQEHIIIDELPEVREKNLINTGLNFIRVKLGTKEYPTAKTGFEAEKEDEVLDNLNIMIIYIYVLVCMINDKKQKKEEFIDLIAENFSPTDPKYGEHLNTHLQLLNEKNYDKFVELYYAEIEKIKAQLVGARQKQETKPKTGSR